MLVYGGIMRDEDEQIKIITYAAAMAALAILLGFLIYKLDKLI